MGHRAVIAIECDDGYEVYRSQWRGSDLSLQWRLAGTDAVDIPDGTDRLGVDSGREAIYDRIDPLLDEALYVVPIEDPVEAYLITPSIVEGSAPRETTADGPFSLVAPTSEDPDGTFLRERVEATRECLGLLVSQGSLGPERASEALVGCLQSWGRKVIVNGGKST